MVTDLLLDNNSMFVHPTGRRASWNAMTITWSG